MTEFFKTQKINAKVAGEFDGVTSLVAAVEGGLGLALVAAASQTGDGALTVRRPLDPDPRSDVRGGRASLGGGAHGPCAALCGGTEGGEPNGAAGLMATRVRRTRGGVRLEQHGCVLSELPSRPGPTHSVFDILAAAVVSCAPGPRVGMLGFAGGGMMAPLRALKGEHEVSGVDLLEEGYRLFREVAREWSGAVEFTKRDACSWLRARRRRFDVLVEDLSVPQDGDVVKPAVSWEVLPPLMARKLRADGVVVTNLLPTGGHSWAELTRACRVADGVVIEFDRFYNRVLVQGRSVGSARRVSRKLRKALRVLGSRTAEEIRVRSFVAAESQPASEAR